MFQELTKADVKNVLPLSRGVPHLCAVDAVIDGTSPGRIWADDASAPTLAMASTEEGEYVVGVSDNERLNALLRTLIVETVLPAGRAAGWAYLLNLRCSSAAWSVTVEDMLGDVVSVKEEREFYAAEQCAVDWKGAIPPGFHMQPVDEELLTRMDLKNIKHVRRWARGNFGSIGAYLLHGFGFCLLRGGDIVSWCLSDCVSGDKCEVGIHTDEEYRRRGFATLTVAAAVDHCLLRGLKRVGWHCSVQNVASAATARKVGFKKVLDYQAFRVDAGETDQGRGDGTNAEEVKT